MNYHPIKKNEVAKNWYVSAFFGTGDGYGVKVFSPDEKSDLVEILRKEFPGFDDYQKKIEEIFSKKATYLQEIFENDLKLEQKSNPINLLKKLSEIIFSYDCHNKIVRNQNILQKLVGADKITSRYQLVAQKQSGVDSEFESQIIYPNNWHPSWNDGEHSTLAANGLGIKKFILESDEVWSLLMTKENK